MENRHLDIQVKRVFKLENSEKTKAFVDIAINDAVLIKGLRVVNGREGLFVSMPQEQSRDKKWYDSVKALNNETKDLISEQVIEAYKATEYA